MLSAAARLSAKASSIRDVTGANKAHSPFDAGIEPVRAWWALFELQAMMAYGPGKSDECATFARTDQSHRPGL